MLELATRPVPRLRDYQQAALTEILARLRAGQRVVLSQATGTGKTCVFVQVAQELDVPTLILVHRDELAQQALERIREWWPGAEFGLVKAENDEWQKRNVVASVQTLAWGGGRRLKRWLQDRFGLVIVDEAHHAVAPSYLSILGPEGYLKPKYLLGVTATPFRGDKLALDKVFDRIVKGLGIRDGIRQKYLADIRPYRIGTGVDLDGVHTRYGDFVEGELSDAVNVEARNRTAVAAYRTYADGKRALVFCVDVAHAHAMAQEFRNGGIPSEVVTGSTPWDERRAIIERLRLGVTQVVTNCMVLCLDSQTEILTTKGWLGMNELTPEHDIANWDRGKIFFDKPKAIIRRDRLPGERMVSLKTPRINLRVTEDHRMLCRAPGARRFKIRPAKELIGRAAQLPISGMSAPLNSTVPQAVIPERRRALVAGSYNLRKQGWSYPEALKEAARRFDLRYALRYKQPSELTLGECRFIGYWIGDGSRTRLQRGGVEYVCTESTHHPFIIRWLDRVVENIGVDVVRKELPVRGLRKVPSIRWSFSRGTGFGPQRKRGLYPLEPYLVKGANWLLWGLEASQFEALIEGLWMANGNHGQGRIHRPDKTIHGTNIGLFSCLQAIAVCRGYRSSIRPARKDRMFRLYFRKRRSIITIGAGNFQPNIEEKWNDEPVWCVTSTSGNIITRRDGYVTVMGNCEGFDCPPVECILLARPTKSVPLFTQQIGRGSRLSPETGKREMVLLDLVDNTLHHKIVSVSELIGLKVPKGMSLLEAENEAIGEWATADEVVRGMGRILKPGVNMVEAADLFLDLDDPPLKSWQDVLEYVQELKDLGSAPWVTECSTEKQQKALSRFGWPPEEAEKLNRGEASAAIDRHAEEMYAWAKESRKVYAYLLGDEATFTYGFDMEGRPVLYSVYPATEKQRSYLESLGFTCPRMLTMGEASLLIDALKKTEPVFSSPRPVDQCYQIFKLEPGCGILAVKQRYRAMAKANHPDAHPEDVPRYTRKFRALNDIYSQIMEKEATAS